MIHLDYRDVRPIYGQIVDGVKEQIATGVLSPGQKLPSVRELATQLTINPNTIARAYKALEMDGWIATVPGKGCFVCQSEQGLHREREKWLHMFDEAAASLAALGVSREALAQRVKEETKK